MEDGNRRENLKFFNFCSFRNMLHIYNTLTRKKEPFISMEDGMVKMYVCGMTTYSDAHIGHARTYVAFDIIRRYLEYKGYEVFYVQNITDIDDKIINAANEKNMDALKYSSIYAKRCLHDMEKIGIRPANLYPKASEHIKEMVSMVEKLVEKGYAYVSNGDVYFSVEKFKDYGKLSKQDMKQIKAGARIKPGEKKRKPEDFALWKAAKIGEPKWNSPWGAGRPGWHIECSVMSAKYLGMPFDIHGGGQDLIFPHHENEIAQAESAYGKRFVNYWLHSGLLKVSGEKMSKSLGNIINIRDALKQWDAEVLRFFFASVHYRSPADFNERALKNAENSLKRIKVMKENLEAMAGKDENFDEKNLDKIEKRYLLEIKELKKKFEEAMDDDFNTPKAIAGKDENFDESELNMKEKNYLKAIEEFKNNFEKAMDDDFNTPKAIEVLFDFIKETNKFLAEKNINKKLCRYALNEFMKIANVLTLLQEKVALNEKAIKKLADKYKIRKNKAEEIIEEILNIRKKARMEKNYKLADEIRDDLKKAGIEIEDVGKETKWRIL